MNNLTEDSCLACYEIKLPNISGQKLAHILLCYSSGLAEIESLLGRCFFHFFLRKSMSQDGTSHPEVAIRLAIFRRKGMSSSV